TIWNDFRFRDDDIIIATYAKAGTTWTQQIIAQLLFDGTEGLEVAEMSPWLDLRVNAEWYKALNDTPGRVGPPIEKPPASVRQYFLDWLERDGHPFAPFWDNLRSWWIIRRLPNVMFLHFAELKADMPAQIRRIAAFLGISIDERHWDAIVEHCTFAYMKQHASKSVPLGGLFWDGGAQVFINKGTDGRWHDTLTAEDCAAYERRAGAESGDPCPRWLATGKRDD